MPEYLYRGICEDEYLADGRVIRPYQLGPFESGVNFDDGHCLDEGLTFDSSIHNSVIKHQKDSRRYPTSGISTTPVFDRAEYYALAGGKKRKGYVLKIDRSLLASFSVQEFVVSDYVPSPKHPEDLEVILYYENGGALPTEVLVDVVEVHSLA